MLVLKVTMVEGRTPEQKAELIRRLAEAAGRHLGFRWRKFGPSSTKSGAMSGASGQ